METKQKVIAGLAIGGGLTAAVLTGIVVGPPKEERSGIVSTDPVPRLPVIVGDGGVRNQVDTDKDGIRDIEDRCPATPVNNPVDSIGCPVPPKAPDLQKKSVK